MVVEARSLRIGLGLGRSMNDGGTALGIEEGHVFSWLGQAEPHGLLWLRVGSGGSKPPTIDCTPNHHRPQMRSTSTMTIARVTEVISSSPHSFEDAVKSGVERAAVTLDNVTGAWVQDQKVIVENGLIAAYRVTMKITFVLNE
jgi:flavin-binding protein dodecin